MPRRVTLTAAVVVAVVLVVGSLLGLNALRTSDDRSGTGAAASPTTAARTAAPPTESPGQSPVTIPTPSESPSTIQAPRRSDGATGYYLALGDSLATGFQLGGDQRTEGYAGAVRAELQDRQGATTLVNLGCSGETTTSISEGGTCRYAQGSQLDEAERFLRDHGDHTRLVTLNIGGNDVAQCGFGGLEPACTKPALATLSANLPTITRRLRAAAPDVRIVLLNYYDPFLVLDLLGRSGDGQRSLAELAKVNRAIARAAAANRAQVADVASAFQTTDTTSTTVKEFGTVPTNLARILTWTWMAPPRFDFHANDAGYAVMAKAVLAELG